MITVRFDGSFLSIGKNRSAHSGIIIYAWVIERDGVELYSGYEAYAHPLHAGSHQAELRGLIGGLKACIDRGLRNENVRVCGDHQSLIGKIEILSKQNKSRHIDKTFKMAVELSQMFKSIEWIWVPRENNYQADALCKNALWIMKREQDEYKRAIAELRYCEKKPAQVHSYPREGKKVLSRLFA